MRPLELTTAPDQDLIRDVNERRAELRQEQHRLATELHELETEAGHTPNPNLLAALPTGQVKVDDLPEDLARSVFEALRPELDYNKDTNQLLCRITLTGSTVQAACNVALSSCAPTWPARESPPPSSPSKATPDAR